MPVQLRGSMWSGLLGSYASKPGLPKISNLTHTKAHLNLYTSRSARAAISCEEPLKAQPPPRAGG